MPHIDLMEDYPKTRRPVDHRAEASWEDRILAKRFGKEYFDGTRRQGCGGYAYDGRWKPVVQRFREHYGLTAESTILDVGCAKGFMLFDFMESIPGVTVAGVDISEYALSHAMEPVKPFLSMGDCVELPYPDKTFDLVVSIATIHNPELDGVKRALKELERVSRGHSFIKVGAYRSDAERIRLNRWNVVANTFLSCDGWVNLFHEVGYTGDYTWFNP